MLRIKKFRLVDSKVCKTEHLAIVFLYFVCLFVNSCLGLSHSHGLDQQQSSWVGFCFQWLASILFKSLSALLFISIVLVKLFGLASLPRVVTAQDQLAHNPIMFTNRLLRRCVGVIKCSISSWGSGSRKLSICWRRTIITIKGEVKSRVLAPLAEKVPLVPL